MSKISYEVEPLLLPDMKYVLREEFTKFFERGGQKFGRNFYLKMPFRV